MTNSANGSQATSLTVTLLSSLRGSSLPQQPPKNGIMPALLLLIFGRQTQALKSYSLSMMMKAWSQKKHRLAMKKRNKKSYNFTLTTSTIDKLDDMAERTGISRNECLENLVLEEYNRFKN